MLEKNVSVATTRLTSNHQLLSKLEDLLPHCGQYQKA